MNTDSRRFARSPHFRRRSRWFALLLLAWLAAGCEAKVTPTQTVSDGSSGQADTSTADTTTGDTTTGDTTTADTGHADISVSDGAPTDTGNAVALCAPGAPLAASCPCAQHSQCGSGVCLVTSAFGGNCAAPCTNASDCTTTQICQTLTGQRGAGQACIPAGLSAGSPCQADADCQTGTPGGLCVPRSGGSVCAAPCTTDADCTSVACVPQTGSAGTSAQVCKPPVVPACSFWAVSVGQTATCYPNNTTACPSPRYCVVGPQGVPTLTPCLVAPLYTEVCNGWDDDCDGLVDEGPGPQPGPVTDSTGLCDDGNPCTTDVCNHKTGCSYQPLSSGPCDDENACTKGDACNKGVCVPGAAIDCDDGDLCTGDGCDLALGCTHTAVDCDDGNICTGDACDGNGGCVTTMLNIVCDDGNACTQGEACSAKGCTGGDPVICDDGQPCTLDTCDPAVGCSAICTPTLSCGGTGTCSGEPCLCPSGQALVQGQCTPCSCDPAGTVPSGLQVAATLTPPVSALGLFGARLRLGGERALIEAPFASKFITISTFVYGHVNQGAMLVYRREPSGSWVYEARLDPPPPSNCVGNSGMMTCQTTPKMTYNISLSRDGLRAMVTGQGILQAWIYEATLQANGSATWSGPITVDTGTNLMSGLPLAVAIDGDYALMPMDVASWPGATTAGQNGGLIALRRKPSGGWLAEIAIPKQTLLSTGYGRAVELEGNRGLVGADWQVVAGLVNRGAATIVERSGNTWSIAADLQPSTSIANQRFGSTLQLVGDRAFVGSMHGGCGGGTNATGPAVTAFRRQANGTWAEQAQVFGQSCGCADDSSTQAIFGYDGNRLVSMAANTTAASAGTGWWVRHYQVRQEQANGSFGDAVRVSGLLDANGQAAIPITILAAGTGRFLALRNGYYGAAVDVLEPGPGPCSASGICACKKGFGGPTCSEPLCDPGVKNSCNDGNQCTVGICGANGTCQQKFINEVCDDGDPCTFNETCVIGKCIGPLTPLCDDFNPCTVDTCDGKGGCIYTQTKGCN